MIVRVLHIGKFFPPTKGGMESFLSDLVRAQRLQGIDSHVLVHGAPMADDPAWVRRVPVQFQLVYAPVAVGFRRALARAIDEVSPDVLHLHMPNNAVFWALTLTSARRRPWIVHWHSDVVVSRTRILLRLAYALYRPFEQAVLRRAERVLVTSPPYLKASEPLSAWRDKCTVVPLGIEVNLPSPSQEAHLSPWLPDRLKLLSIGRLAHYKGFETLIRAVSESRHLQLLIAGQGEDWNRLEALVRSYGIGITQHVQLLGEVSDEDKHRLLSTCDAFCLASNERTEAFGMVLLEAMAHARPCIVTDLPGSGMPWVISSSNAGISSLPPDNVAAWREKLEHLASNREALGSWGSHGRMALTERFSIDACSRTVAAQYHLLLRDASLRPESPPDHTGTLIVIPARDEASTIGQVVRALIAAGWHDVFVIDDHSSDATGDIARQAGATVARPVLPLGAWGGMQLGIRHALAHGYHAVITMDADGQHEVQEVPSLVAASTQADVVIGAHVERASRLRQFAWSWFRTITGVELRDLTSGFRWYNRRAIELLAAHEATLLDYQDIGVLLLLRKAGLRMVEIPVSMNTRQAGKSRIFYSWFSVARYMITTTLLCLARWQVSRNGPSPKGNPPSRS